jgi:hypothetical protein
MRMDDIVDLRNLVSALSRCGEDALAQRLSLVLDDATMYRWLRDFSCPERGDYFLSSTSPDLARDRSKIDQIILQSIQRWQIEWDRNERAIHS